jgi:hypothetical protein
MASDISLAVGDGARPMTYAELAAVRGISPASAKRLAQRHRWGRQVGNDRITRVTASAAATAPVVAGARACRGCRAACRSGATADSDRRR